MNTKQALIVAAGIIVAGIAIGNAQPTTPGTFVGVPGADRNLVWVLDTTNGTVRNCRMPRKKYSSELDYSKITCGPYSSP